MKKACLIKLFILVLFSQSAHAGIFTWMRWGQKVKVCFANPVENSKEEYKRSEWSLEDKASVKQWVEEEYSAERTGIYFHGFDDCVPGKYYNVIINYRKKISIGWSKTTWAESTVGRQSYFVSRDFPGAAGYAIFYIGGIDKKTVVHEFGHIAGLEHEQEHPYAQACGNEKQQPAASHGYTAYDSESLMSTCILRSSDAHRGLSEGDVKTLRLMYVDKVVIPSTPTIFSTK